MPERPQQRCEAVVAQPLRKALPRQAPQHLKLLEVAARVAEVRAKLPQLLAGAARQRPQFVVEVAPL